MATRRRRLSLLLLVAAALIAAAPTSDAPRLASPAERAFLQRHWRRPLPAQGDPPARFSTLERSLAAESCGTCHPVQFADWRTSLHSRSLGPGLTGQLVEMVSTDPELARQCLDCHAPLAEQRPSSERGNRQADNPAFDASLQRQGLVCAACHVRGHQRFGPPRRGGKVTGDAAALPHGGATRTTAFLRSEFCVSCHQFDADGLALNGKLIENTYEEWKASPAARRGLACQDCHMPDRRHLWRGIHDPAMVRSGVEMSVVTDRARYRTGDELQARLIVTSTNVGHAFPTYVTPRVVVRARLVDDAGRTVEASVEEYVIAREVSLDLSREVSDTRIPPGGRATFDYRRRLARPGLRLAVDVTVFPDHFYTRFFEAVLASGAGAGTADVRAALEATRRSPYQLFVRDVPLT